MAGVAAGGPAGRRAGVPAGAMGGAAAGAGVMAGAAFVYQRNTDTNWPFAARLAPSDGEAGEAFGSALGAADDRVVVGSPLDTVRSVGGAAWAARPTAVAKGTPPWGPCRRGP